MAFDGQFYSRELALALSGELMKTIEALDKTIQAVAYNAVLDVVDDIKGRLRGMVQSAGLGSRLAGAVRANFYENPNGGAPAAFIFVQPSAVNIFTAFSSDTTIRSKSAGGLLAIPVQGSPADRKNFGQQRKGETVIETMRQRGVELQFVPGRGDRPAMLVGKSVRLSTRATGRTHVSRSIGPTKTGKAAANTASVPLFWLVPEARIKGRLDWDGEFRRASDTFLTEFARAFDKMLPEKLAQLGLGGVV